MTSLDQSPDAGSPDADTPTYPPAPWTMDGQLWLSLFRVGHDVDALRPRGVYGVALVSYEEPSPLTYSELLVARVVKDPVRAVSITDIWVDSPASVAGGRGLWAIPKELADFRRTSERGTVRERTSWSVDVEGRPVVRARFTDASHAVPRVRFKGATWQPPIDDHVDPVTATLTGSAKAAPCRSAWEIAPDGPLGWLAGARRLASFRQTGFKMTFG